MALNDVPPVSFAGLGNPSNGRAGDHEWNYFTSPRVYRQDLAGVDSSSDGVFTEFNAIPSFTLSGRRMGRHCLRVMIVPNVAAVTVSGYPGNPVGTMILLHNVGAALDLTGSPISTGIGGSKYVKWGSLSVPPWWVSAGAIRFGGAAGYQTTMFSYGMPVGLASSLGTQPEIPVGEYKIIFATADNGGMSTVSVLIQHTD